MRCRAKAAAASIGRVDNCRSASLPFEKTLACEADRLNRTRKRSLQRPLEILRVRFAMECIHHRGSSPPAEAPRAGGELRISRRSLLQPNQPALRFFG